MPDIKNAASVSIVVPFHNEEPNVVEMYWRLHAVMESLGRDHQFVFVDDGSTDLTYKLLKELARDRSSRDRRSLAPKLRSDRSACGWRLRTAPATT